jgi:ACR3 family arsenite efflux pump ArsB
MKRDIKVAAAAGLSLYLPLYWLATRPDSDGSPNPLTAAEVGALLLTLAVYLLVPFILGLLSRYTFAAKIPSWFYVSAFGSAILVLAGAVAVVFIMREPIIVEAPFIAWGVLTLWTMPAAAGVYYFGAAVRLIKAFRRWPDYETLDLRK